MSWCRTTSPIACCWSMRSSPTISSMPPNRRRPPPHQGGSAGLPAADPAGYIRERLGRISEAEQDFDRALKDEVLTVRPPATPASSSPMQPSPQDGPGVRFPCPSRSARNTQDGAVTARRDVANAQIAIPASCRVMPTGRCRCPTRAAATRLTDPSVQLVPATTPPWAERRDEPCLQGRRGRLQAYGKGDDKHAEAKILRRCRRFPTTPPGGAC